MFTPYMTKAELQREAYLDYLELRPRVRLAFGQFRYDQQAKNIAHPLMHSIVSTKAVSTKRGNTWKVMFYARYHMQNHVMVAGHLIYIPFYRKGEQVDYIFLRAPLEGFAPEVVTAHFLQRYKERYLEPNKVNIKGMPPAVYFQRSTDDMRPTDFVPDNWTPEDMENKMIWISDQGLFVTSFEDKLRTYITFLDQENLSRYKAQIYEEEDMMRLYKRARDEKDWLKQVKLYSYLFSRPNAVELMERYLRRTTDPKCVGDVDKFLEKCIEQWKNIRELTEKIMGELDKRHKEEQKKKFDGRGYKLDLDDFLKG